LSEVRELARCSCCHDSLAVSLAARCPDCATLAHPDCLVLVTRCPTLGCDGVLLAPRDVLRDFTSAAANALTMGVMFVAGVAAVGWLVMSMAMGILETFTGV
jgi:hypothetical protein